MQFNSLNFAYFFLSVYIIYLLLNHKWQNKLLLLASYAFYCFWDWRFLPLLVLSTVVNFYCGSRIDKLPAGRERLKWLIICLAFNLGVLGIFKYFNFFSEGLRTILWLFGFQPDPVTLNIILPLGISFYTFQVMSYSLDIYWNRLRSTERFFDFALFVAFFPQIISGPIERARNMLPQIFNKRVVTPEKFYSACWLIFWGLYKKLVIADNLAKATTGFFYGYTAGTHGGLTLFMACLFSIQLYADFSGYSDMARGIAMAMGFDIMQNFKAPFFSKNPSELWQRWHISLTTWIKEYLYYPLGLAQVFGRHMAGYAVILLTWGIMGIWHGPEGKYLIWGIYHGLLIILYSRSRLFSGFLKINNRFITGAFGAIGCMAMFVLFSVGIIFFAAHTTSSSLAAIRDIVFNFTGTFKAFSFGHSFFGMMIVFLIPAGIIEFFQYRSGDEFIVLKWHYIAKGLIYYVLLYLIIIYGVFSVQKYYYFQF